MALAEIKLATYFTDHTVLQHGKTVPVWGWAKPGDKVEVSFAGQRATATAGADGRWVAALGELAVSTEGRSLTVKAGKDVVELKDVVVGDVYLLGGQSNMEWGMGGAQRAAEETPVAKFPLIRHLKVEKAKADVPQDTAPTRGGWTVCSPETVGGFSAVGYYFAKEVHSRLGIPLGLVNATWGGTNCETWIPAGVYTEPGSPLAYVLPRWAEGAALRTQKQAEYDQALAAWKTAAEAAKAAGKAFKEKEPELYWELAYPQQPSACYNAMVHPLLPLAVRGVLWYQGESNAGRPAEYATVFKNLIHSWRAALGGDDVPFYFVQLPNYKDNDGKATNWARTREAQASALSLPNTAMVVALDIGNNNDIHPLNKHEVGRRLALIARAKIYGQSVDFSGPVFASAVREGASFRLSFRFTAGALTADDKPLEHFEVAGADRVFYPAKAVIQRDTVVVSAPQVKEPVAVRYAFSNALDVNFFNGAGLPAAPFRTDDWE